MSKTNENEPKTVRANDLEVWREAKTRLEAKQALTEIVALADDPIDAMRVMADYYAMSAFSAELAASGREQSPPQPPVPISKLMQRFAAKLKEKAIAIHDLLSPIERRRLAKLGPPLSVHLQAPDREVVESIIALICMPPEEAAQWLRSHLGEIEIRLAS